MIDKTIEAPPRENESLNLLEMEILRVLNHQLPGHTDFTGTPKFELCKLLERHLGALNSPQLRFAPPQQIVQAWREWAAEGNEWVRREYFSDRPSLFAPPREQKENYELTQLTPGCWEALGRVMAELGEENFLLRRELQRLRSQADR